METNEGQIALVLVSALIAQFKATHKLDVAQFEHSLALLRDRPLTEEQMAALDAALTSLQGLKGMEP